MCAWVSDLRDCADRVQAHAGVFGRTIELLYLWLKAFHIIFVVALMGSLLIYPRYKIHQLSSAPGEPLFDTLRDASNRLRRIIMTPSMVLVWVLGIAMIVVNPALLSGGWLYAKIVLVVILSAVHGYFLALGKRIDAGLGSDAQVPTGRQMRMLNEVPFLLMIVIVILVVVRPF